jgi:hypothetical protein
MNMPRSTAEEILRRKIEPALKAVRSGLEAAQVGVPGDPPVALALVTTSLLELFVAKIAQRVADQDVAERVAVYSVVTDACAKSLGQPVPLVFPAVLGLCEVDDELKGDFPAPDPALAASLSAALLQVIVTYEVDVGKPGRRTVKVLLRDAAERGVRETTSTVGLQWEDIPEDVRGQAIRQDQRTFSFLLHPREGR